MQMNEQLQPVMDWLEAHIGGNLHIRKLEQGDLDEIKLKLEQKGIHDDHSHMFDDYTGGPVLYLRGEGWIIRPGGTEVPLPQDTYLIPVKELKQAHIDGHTISVETGRARYDITDA